MRTTRANPQTTSPYRSMAGTSTLGAAPSATPAVRPVPSAADPRLHRPGERVGAPVPTLQFRSQATLALAITTPDGTTHTVAPEVGRIHFGANRPADSGSGDLHIAVAGVKIWLTRAIDRSGKAPQEIWVIMSPRDMVVTSERGDEHLTPDPMTGGGPHTELRLMTQGDYVVRHWNTARHAIGAPACWIRLTASPRMLPITTAAGTPA